MKTPQGHCRRRARLWGLAFLLAAGVGRGAAQEDVEPGDLEDADRLIRSAMVRISGPPDEAPPPDRPALLRRVTLASLSMKQPAWIPDVDQHAAEAQAQAIREDARILSLRGEGAAAIEKLEQFAADWLPDSTAGKVLEDIVDVSFRVADYERALKTLNQLHARRGNDPSILCNLAAVKIHTGNYAEAQALLDSIDVLSIRRPVLLASVLFNRACLHSRLGRRDEAISALYAAYTTLPDATLLWFTDPQLDAIRDDARLGPLRKAMHRTRAKKMDEELRARLTLAPSERDREVEPGREDVSLTLRAR